MSMETPGVTKLVVEYATAGDQARLSEVIKKHASKDVDSSTIDKLAKDVITLQRNFKSESLLNDVFSIATDQMGKLELSKGRITEIVGLFAGRVLIIASQQGLDEALKNSQTLSPSVRNAALSIVAHENLSNNNAEAALKCVLAMSHQTKSEEIAKAMEFIKLIPHLSPEQQDKLFQQLLSEGMNLGCFIIAAKEMIRQSVLTPTVIERLKNFASLLIYHGVDDDKVRYACKFGAGHIWALEDHISNELKMQRFAMTQLGILPEELSADLKNYSAGEQKEKETKEELSKQRGLDLPLSDEKSIILDFANFNPSKVLAVRCRQLNAANAGDVLAKKAVVMRELKDTSG